MQHSLPMRDAQKPPASVVRWWDPFLITVLILVVYVPLSATDLSATDITLLVVLAISLVMVTLEIAQAPWRKVARPHIALSVTLRRSGIKILGLMLGILLVIGGWFLIHNYRYAIFNPLFDCMPYVLPPILMMTVAATFYTEWRLGPSEDHSWQFGLLALGRWQQVDWSVARNGLFGWIVKGYFLPMNFCSAVEYIGKIRGKEADFAGLTWPQAETLILNIIFTALLFGIIPGYLFSARLIGTENRRIDQTAFGWFVTLMCYPPVNTGTGQDWFVYKAHDNHETWITVFGSNGSFAYIIGGLIILCELFHYWGEVACHIHSAHLSHRGIITNGPFRYCKHPVYVIKCIGWTLIWLPFLSGPTRLDSLRHTLGFAAFCFIYALRGWIEERLLSNDPTYVAYATWVEQHGLFRWVGAVIPFFNYSWRLRWWRGRGEVEISLGTK